MAALLPKLPCPVRAPRVVDDLLKRIRHPLLAEIGQLSAGELAHIPQCTAQAFIVKILVKHNQMNVCGHDDVGIDTQCFMVVAIVEAFSDNQAGFFSDKNGQPFDDGESQVINSGPILDLARFHKQTTPLIAAILGESRGDASFVAITQRQGKWGLFKRH